MRMIIVVGGGGGHDGVKGIGQVTIVVVVGVDLRIREICS
jgi:hypothetical protein